MSTRAAELTEWLRQRVAIAGSNGIVVGLSGGIDSAVVIRLAQIAADGNVVGVIMPCYSDPQDEADARLVAGHFNLPTVRMDLAPSYDRLVADLRTAVESLPGAHGAVAAASTSDPRARLPLANVKPRLRMAELEIGYFTKYGDGGVDLLPLGRLLKSEVRELARELEVPEPIITKAPSAGLWLGQTDETEMGFTYADLESYLTKGPEAVAPALAMRIERLVRASEHKRALAPMPPE